MSYTDWQPGDIIEVMFPAGRWKVHGAGVVLDVDTSQANAPVLLLKITDTRDIYAGSLWCAVRGRVGSVRVTSGGRSRTAP